MGAPRARSCVPGAFEEPVALVGLPLGEIGLPCRAGAPLRPHAFLSTRTARGARVAAAVQSRPPTPPSFGPLRSRPAPPPDPTPWRNYAVAIGAFGMVAAALYFAFRSPSTARVGPKPSPAGKTVVLLHGHGAPADDLVSFARQLAADAPSTTFFTPPGPHSVPGGGRTWIPSMTAPSREAYVGMLATAMQPVVAGVWSVVEDARKRGVDCASITVGGFSLGGRMAAHVALRAPADCRLGGVLVLSGGGADEADLPTSAAGPLRILVTHGRRDGVIPFARGEDFARALVAAGHRVRWVAFDGGHQLAPIAADVSRFLQGVDVGVDGATL